MLEHRNFAVLMITPIALESIGWQYYIIYAVIGACIPVLVFFFYPETMGRSLEQMVSCLTQVIHRGQC